MNADDTVLLLNVEAERQKRAITKAQDEAYERAALACEERCATAVDGDDYWAIRAVNGEAKKCAIDIRNLKSKP